MPDSTILKNFKTKTVNIAEITSGDTIIHLDGYVRTVCKNNIKTGFCGITLFGDSYNMGSLLVNKILI